MKGTLMEPVGSSSAVAHAVDGPTVHRHPDTLPDLLKEAIGSESLRAIAARSRGALTADQLSRVLTGKTVRPSIDSLRAMHEHLGIPLEGLLEARGLAPDHPTEPFVLPARAEGLDRRERALIVALVDALLAARAAGTSDGPA